MIGALEEAGLPIDVVTGTSMGSVVGGLYAVGYGPDELEGIVRELDWNALLTDRTPRGTLDVERRLVAGETLVSLPIDGGGVDLPGGVIEGQRVLELLSRLTWPYHGVRDFRQLPRPFTAVAMDILTGDAVPLSSGSLPLAMRASMSIPGLFAPVHIDGRLFVDGGFARNLPAEDALLLGADYLVCVDVGDPPPDEEELVDGSLVTILLRTAFLRGEASTAMQRRFCDVLVEPAVDSLGLFDFDLGDEWIRLGRTAVDSVRPELEALMERVGRPPGPGLVSPEIERVVIDRVDVEGASTQGELLVRQRLRLDVPGVVSADEVTQAVGRVHGSGEFALVSYEILPLAGEVTPGGADRHRLLLRVDERGRDLVGFGFRYDSRERAALLFDLALRNRLGYGSMTRLSVRLGRETELGLAYFDRLAVSAPTGIGGGLRYTRVPVRLFEDERAVVAGDLVVYAADAFLSYSLANAVIVRGGLTGEISRAEFEVGLVAPPDSADVVEEVFYAPWVEVIGDTRDRTDLPSRGWRAHGRAEFADDAIGSGTTFQHYVLEAEGYVPLGARFTLMGRAAFTRGRGDGLPPSRATFIGGTFAPSVLPGRFYPLFGLEPQQLAGESGQAARLGLRWMPTEELFFEAAGDAGAVGSGWTLDPGELEFGIGLTAGLVTPIGPVSLTLAGSAIDDLPDLGFRLGYDF